MKFSLKEAAESIGGIYSGENDIEISSVSTDTRTILKGSLFVALEGENFDGHDYIEQAVEKGASAVLIHKDVKCDIPTVKVSDTGKAYIALSGYYRSLKNVKVVAVTGSVGKTTTKDFISCVAEAKYITHKSLNNENNEVGMPKTVFSSPDNAEVLVLEMGMCALGEIEQLSLPIKPDIGVITNIGVSHLEHLGSRENILKAKMEIVSGMGKNSPLILNGDDDLLRNAKSDDYKIILYGIENAKNTLRAFDIVQGSESTSFTMEANGEKIPVCIPTVGTHNVNNALSAVAVGIELGISPTDAAKALENYSPSGMRQKMSMKNGIIFFEDCYNSSPDSVAAALKTLSTYPTNGRKIAVLGDILELGEYSKEAHIKSGVLAAENSVDILLTYGEESRHTYGAAKNAEINAHHFISKEDMAKKLIEIIKPDDVVWVKASRGMRLEDFLHIVYDGI